jgi:hypothetical protein
MKRTSAASSIINENAGVNRVFSATSILPSRSAVHSFTIYRRSRNPRPSKIAGIAFSIRAVRVADCFAPAK